MAHFWLRLACKTVLKHLKQQQIALSGPVVAPSAAEKRCAFGDADAMRALDGWVFCTCSGAWHMLGVPQQCTFTKAAGPPRILLGAIMVRDLFLQVPVVEMEGL